MEKQDGKKKATSKDADKEDDDESFGETYASLVKLVQKEYSKQSFWTKGESKA